MLRRFRHWLALALLASGAGLSAQGALSIQPTHCVYHEGYNPAWAGVRLDESSWTPASQWVAVPTPRPYFWLRCRFLPAALAPAVQPVLQIAGDVSYQVFVNGNRVGAFGDIFNGSHTAGIVRDYAFPRSYDRAQPLLVALRMTFALSNYGQEKLPELTLGDEQLQRGQYAVHVAQTVFSNWITWICYTFIVAAGLFFFTLFWFDRTQIFLLWGSLCWLALSLLRLNEFLIAASIHFPLWLEYLFCAFGNSVFAFYIPFFFALAEKPVNRFFRLIWALAVIYPATLVAAALLPFRAGMVLRWVADASPGISASVPVFLLIAALSPIAAFWPLRRLRRSQVPLVAVGFAWMLIDSLYMGAQFPIFHLGPFFYLVFQPVRSVAIAAVIIALTLLLIQRIRATNRQRASLSGEMQAAAEIQRTLVPATLGSIRGLNIQAEFRPAAEVGGDFYQVIEQPDGCTLVIVGDVSGKGLKAAMKGVLALGALRTLAAQPIGPAALLAGLNREMLRAHDGGFITCLCLRIPPDGHAVAANAGHLSPYRDGKEIELNCGLPLGISPDAQYAETVIDLGPGETITLLTDGVVEARNAAGELFGFDRAANLSSQSAESIAQAAQAFGQEDDITVLTLTRLETGAQSVAAIKGASLASA